MSGERNGDLAKPSRAAEASVEKRSCTEVQPVRRSGASQTEDSTRSRFGEVSWYFEDFYPGQDIDLGTRRVTEEEIIAFAAQFDPQPFHVDHEAAGRSIYGGVIASGWHTCSMMMRMVVDGLMAGAASMGSPGLDGVRWLAPVRPDDTLNVHYQTLKVKASSSRPDRGVVWSKWVAINQHGETVCTIEGMGMFARRPGGPNDA